MNCTDILGKFLPVPGSKTSPITQRIHRVVDVRCFRQNAHNYIVPTWPTLGRKTVVIIIQT